MDKKVIAKKRAEAAIGFNGLKTVYVFGIARALTEKRAMESLLLAEQRKIMRNFVRSKSKLCAPQEWRLVCVFFETKESIRFAKGRGVAVRDNKLGLQKALELAKAGHINVVVVPKLTYLARNLRDLLDIYKVFRRNNVAIIALDTGIDTSTPDGRLLMDSSANLFQWQAAQNARRRSGARVDSCNEKFPTKSLK